MHDDPQYRAAATTVSFNTINKYGSGHDQSSLPLGGGGNPMKSHTYQTNFYSNKLDGYPSGHDRNVTNELYSKRNLSTHKDFYNQNKNGY